ncbi:MAG: tat (twin-arginine translocation) pathway signal sequence [Pseudomonas sp.]|uniref:tat (twin-arginine translocation) pathway signal sequence n=1 Tax=Pseudomonas abieticivorans TaxID=2931382 RepID=UPI0020C06B85|nr:tat (twin-arginine translocation) pathway signal sequence [Pseudomonas sp. PIA16]MDE1169445.1 tat (twin-arginine translocation) pathway signal sequence [Pseudomonas sp.]
MNDLKLDRRRFLQGSGGLLLGTLLFTSGPIALLAPSQSWAMALTTLDSDTGARLLVMVRRIYPHDSLEDAAYAFSVKALDDKASQDPGVAQQLKDGVAQLDKQAGGHWLKLDETHQVKILETLQDSPFFALVRATAVGSLYSNELAYAHFGYEGASFPKGGYLLRGFNDLTWLPAPPADASPDPFA